MSRYRPTVFISVPRKWMQLYDTIALQADPLESRDEEILDATRAVTGGRLRWGLSAAGHLDVEIFRFFHKHGIQVGSGFGMSEATGGITMTPPFGYRDGSLGVALPGIEIKLAEDGELLMRGPYVMMGYLDLPDDEPSFDDDGWLHSGDLMTMDRDGHVKLVDRKKEIYKNVKGQTIAPQRIENLFREFESVGRVFLVGDHKPYNTLLIYPNPAYEELDFSAMSGQDVKDHFRSLVVSVNRFVAPFERVVDFAIIDRDLDADKGELTPKGTPRRKAVVENFDDVIAALYRRADLEVGGTSLTLPNWLFQTLGITTQDLMAEEQGIALPPLGTSLSVQRRDERRVQLGSCEYSAALRTLDLGVFLATPRLWLGNEELVALADLDPAQRSRPGRARDAIDWVGRTAPYDPTEADRAALSESMRHTEWGLDDLDRAARLLGTDDVDCVLDAVRFLEKVVTNEEGPLAEPARFLLDRCATSAFGDVRRRGFQMLVPTERPARFPNTLHRFFEADPALLDAETSEFLCERSLPESKIEAFITFAEHVCDSEEVPPERIVLAQTLLRFLAEYGAAHPARFRTTREFLVRMSLFAGSAEIRGHAADARVTLEFGFRQFLGSTAKIAVDPETGQEYRWEDVVVFEEGTSDEDRRRLLSAIRSTPFLREAVFLFYRGTMVRLHDIPPGGVWIRMIDTRHGKAVYRITVQTRAQNTYDFSANVNQSLSSEDVQEEIDWLILCGDSGHGEPVVENFGGYLADQDIWTEEFVSGDTLDREMRRLARRSDPEENLEQLWPFLAWSALSAYVDFWERTRRRLEIAELSMSDIVLPTHDYHTGSRIVSLSARRPHSGLLVMLQSFGREFVEKVVKEHPGLEGIVGWDVVFSSVLEVVGEKEGLAMYERALEEETGVSEGLRSALAEYVVNVGWRGFLPMRLYFAAKRYRRWARLSKDATATACARTLQEFYDTYGLDRLALTYPEVRLRFFRETVFRETSPELAAGLDELIARVRAGELVNGELAGAIADLRQRLRVAPDDDYFLARIPFAHLQPEDAVHFVTTDLGGSAQSEIVVNLEDVDGSGFRVRHVLLPKEVERLHRQEQSVQPFDLLGHVLLPKEVERLHIFYETEEGVQSAHLEKIVVAEGYRRKGVADGLMKEFFNRLRSAGAKRVTTGFFRPEYFYSYGFKIERKYAGLVKELDEEKAM
jgi:GNAT superfamily N-acetyltransferase